jgi:hypothetical protein
MEKKDLSFVDLSRKKAIFEKQLKIIKESPCAELL